MATRHGARRQAVVSHLPVVEEMSGVDVLCADKTGTITRNELALADVAVVGEGGRSRPGRCRDSEGAGRAGEDCEVLDFEPFGPNQHSGGRAPANRDRSSAHLEDGRLADLSNGHGRQDRFARHEVHLFTPFRSKKHGPM
jgi:magnesium-transporting ATPase (P-type)